MSYSIDPALGRVITQHFPAATSAGSFFPLTGLTGQTGKVVIAEKVLLARHQHPVNVIPGVDRQREYHILRKLSGSGLGPAVYGFAERWLLLGWQPGEVLSPQQFIQQLDALVPLIARLHCQPLSGYRLSLLRLLEQYWLLSDPARRHCGWLRALRRLQRQGEPKPLRLALLHMDIHAGNVINTLQQLPEREAASNRDKVLSKIDAGNIASSQDLQPVDGDLIHNSGKKLSTAVAHNSQRLRLIDWEYASDGDVALELATIVAGNELNEQQKARLTAAYAAAQQLDPAALARQMNRWQPWLKLLMASWYELRWQQTQERTFFTLAAQAWQRVLSE